MSRIEDKVCAKFQHRAELGKLKYGVTLERTDLNMMDWANHLQEELMDACNYLERFMECDTPTNDDYITILNLMISKLDVDSLSEDAITEIRDVLTKFISMVNTEDVVDVMQLNLPLE